MLHCHNSILIIKFMVPQSFVEEVMSWTVSFLYACGNNQLVWRKGAQICLSSFVGHLFSSSLFQIDLLTFPYVL